MRFMPRLSSGILGKADPIELWEEITSHISDEVLLKKGVKILCVACGHGTEADVLVKRMKSLGISSKEIKESIYLIDKYQEFTNYVIQKGYTNVIRADFMEWEIDMKFDVILINPPYQDSSKNNNATSLWIPMLKKCIELGGIVAAVSPINWLNIDMAKYQFLKESKISKAKIYDLNNTPFKGVGIRVGYMIIEGKNDNSNTIFVDSNTNEEISINLNISGNLPGQINNSMLSIWNKTMTLDKKMGITRKGQLHTQRKAYWSETKSKKFKYPLYRSDEYVWSSIKKENYDDIKVIIPESRSHKKTVVAKNCNTSQSAYYVKVDSEVQGENIRNVICSNLFTFLIESSKWGPALSQSTLENLPYIDPNVEWTDEELYSHFDLTQEEIDYIESHFVKSK